MRHVDVVDDANVAAPFFNVDRVAPDIATIVVVMMFMLLLLLLQL
jgi:hypothetical protein